MRAALVYSPDRGNIHLHHVGGVLEARVAAGLRLAPVPRVPVRLGGRAGDLRRALAADYQAHARGRRLPVQGDRGHFQVRTHCANLINIVIFFW